MPVPIISKIQSVLQFRQWLPFVYQPFATESPTSWSCTPLPPGVVFTPATGRIEGPATMPGVYIFELRATNASGTSTPEVFTLGIDASGYVQPANIVEVFIDVTTRRVSLTSTFADNETEATDKQAAKLKPILWMKHGDTYILAPRFLKGGVVADLDITNLRFVLKQYEPERLILDAGGAGFWGKVGTGPDASFRLCVQVVGNLIKSALTEYESDSGTQFLALGEFEWTENNPTSPRIGPATITSSSRTFGVQLPRDLAPNA